MSQFFDSISSCLDDTLVLNNQKEDTELKIYTRDKMISRYSQNFPRQYNFIIPGP